MTEWNIVIYLSFKICNHNIRKDILRNIESTAIKRKLNYDVSIVRKVTGVLKNSSELNFPLLNQTQVLSIKHSSVLER